jgi:hypothetical protein
LKEINWRRREEVLRAGRGGAFCHVQITDCCHPIFHCWIIGIEIFIDDHFPFNNEFRTGLYFKAQLQMGRNSQCFKFGPTGSPSVEDARTNVNDHDFVLREWTDRYSAVPSSWRTMSSSSTSCPIWGEQMLFIPM